MSIPRTGSQGLTRDLWAFAHAGCYGEDGCQGWLPDSETRETLYWHEEARFDRETGLMDSGEPFRVPFNPKCKKCGQAAKKIMERRGLNREQVKRLFDRIGAKWHWTSRESDQKRRESDRGEMVIDASGNVTTDRAIKVRQRREQRRIEHKDRQAAKAARATKA